MDYKSFKHLKLALIHYEAKLCILCTVGVFRNRLKSNLSRNPQHSYFSIFFAVLDSTKKYIKHCTVQNCQKKRICGIRNRICGIQNSLWNPHTNNETCAKLN